MTLMLKSAAGRYRKATKQEVCEQAASYGLPDIIGHVLDTPRTTVDFLRAQLQWRESEAFGVVFVDNRNRVIKFEILFHGTIDQSPVFPREVAKRALEYNAAAVILAHNHPSGFADPSQADELITTRLKAALALFSIKVLDHIIIGANTHESFASRGLL